MPPGGFRDATSASESCAAERFESAARIESLAFMSDS
jgi:hypothetical protein